MKWAHHKPRHKAVKIARRFLFMPLTIGSETRWLEFAFVKMVYWDPWWNCSQIPYWSAVKFIDRRGRYDARPRSRKAL